MKDDATLQEKFMKILAADRKVLGADLDFTVAQVGLMNAELKIWEAKLETRKADLLALHELFDNFTR